MFRHIVFFIHSLLKKSATDKSFFIVLRLIFEKLFKTE